MGVVYFDQLKACGALFDAKTTFSIFFCHKCLKNAKNNKKTCHKGGLPAIRCYSWLTPGKNLIFLFLIFPLVMEKYEKLVFVPKQIISTSKRRTEHPFAVQNTQQVGVYKSFYFRPQARMNVLQLKNVSHARTSKQIKSMGTFLKRKGT